MYHVRPYDGVVQMLDSLKKKEIKIAVFSNKPHLQAIDVVESTFGKGYFDHIQGQSGEFPKKPDPEGLLWILDKLGVSPEEGIYIGDSDVDMKTGKAAGMFTVGAEWGFRTKELLVETGADATIAVIEVPMKEASRFGIMNTDDENRIIEFEEKPEHPKSNLASMGIYIFNWKLLRKKLVADMKDPDSNHDFGKDIIPTLLNDGKKLYAYKFKGYWKDVGTIDSLWEANMDLLSKNNELDLNDPTWKIYTEDATALPQYIGPDAEINHAFVNQGCVIEGEITNSVLFTGAKVGKGAKIINSVLMPGVVVDENAVVTRALVADNVKIGAGAVVGDAKSEHIELISKRVKGVE